MNSSSPTSAAFVAQPGRDAWATVRGFAYQVDLTLERWAGLAGNEALILESGEDIDLVADALRADGERLLEQVKVRESASLSLSSAIPREALANAARAARENPELLLKFRFTTTATVARERSLPSKDWPSGIVLWEEVRTGIRPAGDPRPTEILRALLHAKRPPPGIPAVNWAELVVVRDDQLAFAELVRRFEWSMGSPAPERMQDVVVAALVAGQVFDKRPEAERAYASLFLHLVRVLSQRGEKRLTRDGLLTAASAARSGEPLSRADSLAWQRLIDLGARVTMVEGEVTAAVRRIAAVEERTDALEAAVGERQPPPADLLPPSPPPRTSPPLLAAALGRRQALVGAILGGEGTWLSIHGPVGLGKTHLAWLVAHAAQREQVWLRFNGGASAEAQHAWWQMLCRWLGSAPACEQDLVEQIAARLAGGATTLILDDLCWETSEPLVSVLVQSLRAASASPRAAVLTTSVLPPPPSALSAAGGALTSIGCPPFSSDETAELFASLGGAHFASAHPKPVEFMTSAAEGHPILLTAMAAVLRESGWRPSPNVLQSILGGEYARRAAGETATALSRTVRRPSDRELLERLRLWGRTFDTAVIHLLASVPPVIEDPLPSVGRLEALWLQRGNDGKWHTSPLLRTLPTHILPPATEARCHVALAEHISRSPLDEAAACSAISHWVQAGEPDKAALMLFGALSAWPREPARPVPVLLLALWRSAPFPDAMSVGFRILVRHAQLLHGGVDRDALEAELDGLLSMAADSDMFAVILVVSARLRVDFTARPSRVRELCIRLFEAAARAKLPDGRAYPIPDLSPAVWLLAGKISSPEQLEGWLGLLDCLPKTVRGWTTGRTSVFTICIDVAHDIISREHNRSGGPIWSDAFDQLRAMETTARAVAFPFLEACAVRGKIAILIGEQRRVDEALAMASEFLAVHGASPQCRFAIEDIIGRQLMRLGNPAAAMAHLERALACWPDCDGYLACYTANLASQAAAKLRLENPTGYQIMALRFAREGREVPPQAEAVERSELALALFHDGDIPGAARALLGAAAYFEAHRGSSGFVDHIGVAILQTVLCLGHVISKRPSGIEMRVPDRGFVHEQPLAANTSWTPASPALMAIMLVAVAEAIDDAALAERWAKSAFRARPLDGVPHVSTPLEFPLLAYLVRSDHSAAGCLAVMEQVGATVELLRASAIGDPTADTEHPGGPAVCFGVLPAALAAGALSLDDAALAARIATVLGDTSRRIGEGSPAAAMWEEVAAGFRGAPHESHLARYDRARGWMAKRGHGMAMLQLLWGSLTPGAPLDFAIQVQAELAAMVCANHPGVALQGVLERFLDKFWQRQFATSKFHFRAPALVAREIDLVAELPQPLRVRKLIQIMASGLGAPLSQMAREWCTNQGRYAPLVSMSGE